jgi:hypothetical protein
MFSDWWTDAKREMEKKMGGNVLDADQQNPSFVKCPRRPGLSRYEYILFFKGGINCFICSIMPVSIYRIPSPFFFFFLIQDCIIVHNAGGQ